MNHDTTTSSANEEFKAVVRDLYEAGNILADQLATCVNGDEEAYEESRDAFDAWAKAVDGVRSLIAL